MRDGCCRLSTLCASGLATSLAPKTVWKKTPQKKVDTARGGFARPARLHRTARSAATKQSSPRFRYGALAPTSDLQLHIFARLVIGRALARHPLARKWEATAPSQTRQRLRHNPDAIVIAAGGFQRCRPPPTECAARRGVVARHCRGTGCKNLRRLRVRS